MRYYAFKHRYGARTVRSGESATGTLHIFEKKSMRDEWVRGGPAAHEQGARTKIKASHPKVQEYKRYARKGYDMGRVLHKSDGTVKKFYRGTKRTN